MKRVLEGARASYDWVIMDTPPIGVVSDAKLLSEMVDGVVPVVEAQKSAYSDILRSIEFIGRQLVMGVVLNRLQRVRGGAQYYASYYGRQPAQKTRDQS